jgi:hypothetical protein
MFSTAKSDVLDRPYFGENARNITALTDETVTLKCSVKNRGNRTVRHRVLEEGVCRRMKGRNMHVKFCTNFKKQRIGKYQTVNISTFKKVFLPLFLTLQLFPSK